LLYTDFVKLRIHDTTGCITRCTIA